ncbi:hypothetical protein LguiA_022060 [Lonicera macranthoides]
MMAVPVTQLPEHFNSLPLPLPEQLCRPFSFAEILSATNNFDDSLVIGQGGFGKVYKGVIDNGASIVAIKRLSSASKQGDSEFRTEIELLSKFRHSHIVSFIGYCYSSTEMILVYEHMANGSLADHLHKLGKYSTSSNLSWVQRLKICLGAARGLDYLHTGTGVIHQDMKSSNILVDKNCAAKVSDFAVDFTLDEKQWSLARWAQCCIEKGTLHRVINPNLWSEILHESLKEFVRIANQCLCYRPKKRPTMTQVVSSLELALALQLGHKDSSAFEMEIIYTSESDEIIENADSTMVQEERQSFMFSDEASDSPYLPPVPEEASSSSSEPTDDGPLPAIEGLQISGEPFPGRELQASGYSINGTRRCNFYWVRHLEDGSVKYIDGAAQPSYLVTADDVDTTLAVVVQPMDDKKRNGELVKVFANEDRKITCDSELQNHLLENLYNGHATSKVTMSMRSIGIWEPATLLIKQEGYIIKRSGPNAAIVIEKFSPSTIVKLTCGSPTEFSIIGTGDVKHVLRADESSPQDIKCSRDAIVPTIRLFLIRAGEKKKGKKRGLFFNKIEALRHSANAKIAWVLGEFLERKVASSLKCPALLPPSVVAQTRKMGANLSDQDLCIWTATSDSKFSSASALLWRALKGMLHLGDVIQRIGIQLASECVCVSEVPQRGSVKHLKLNDRWISKTKSPGLTEVVAYVQVCAGNWGKGKNKAKCDGVVLFSETLDIRDRHTSAAILVKCARSEIAVLKEFGLLNVSVAVPRYNVT